METLKIPGVSQPPAPLENEFALRSPAAVIAMGVFYTIVMLAQTLGFGVDKQGTEAFAGSSSPLGQLSKSYVGPIMADAVNFGVMVSAFASALGTATGGS